MAREIKGMTKEDYELKLTALQGEYDSKKRDIHKVFALSNNPYKVGDLFTDHIGTIRIERIGIYLRDRTPMCYYKGANLLKNGQVSKREPKREAYQQNDKTLTSFPQD